jgi:hypothetical protein
MKTSEFRKQAKLLGYRAKITTLDFMDLTRGYGKRIVLLQGKDELSLNSIHTSEFIEKHSKGFELLKLIKQEGLT